MYTAGRATDQDLNYDPFGEHKIAGSKGDYLNHAGTLTAVLKIPPKTTM